MSNVLKDATTWLSGKFQQFASEVITYKRGNTSLAINATPGRTELPIEDTHGVTLSYMSHDWIFPVALLTLTPPTPQQGDTITDAAGKIYTVMFDGASQPYSVDEFGVDYRVHTKLSGAV